jgi:hypothetical protein
VVVAPINTASGFLDAGHIVRAREEAWEADVRAGMPPDDLVRKHFPEYGPAMQAEIRHAVRLMRARRYTYYKSPGEEGS